MQRTGVVLAAVCLCCGLAAAGADDAPVVRVVDTDGRPVPGASVDLQKDNGSERLVADDEGLATLAGVEAGTYDLVVEARGYQIHRSQVVVGGGGGRIDVRLKRPFTQELVVTATLPELTEQTISGVEMQDRPVIDLGAEMRGHRGLEAFRRGPINLDPTVRGLHETQVGMFVDGTRTFAAGPGRMDSEISHVSPHAVEQVRVVKGPYALTWGAGTLSALRVDTYKPDFSGDKLRVEGSAAAGYAENGEVADVHGAVGGSTDRYRFQVFAGVRQGEDYESGSGETVPASFESTDTRWSFGFRPGDSTMLEYSGGYQAQNNIDYAGRQLDATYFYTHSHALDFEWSPGGKVGNLSAQLYVNDKKHRMNNDNKPTALPDPGGMRPPLDVDLPTQSDTAGGNVKLTLGSERLQWQVGTDFYDLQQSANRTISNRLTGMVMFEDIAWPDSTIRDLGLYAQVTRQRGNTRFGGTVRVDFWDTSAGEVSQFFLDNTTGSLDQDDTIVSAAFSSAVGLSPAWTLTAGIGRAVRTPTALELYSDRFPSTQFQVSVEVLGNPSLAPESSLELDVGATGKVGRAQLSFDLFYRTIDDYVALVPDPTLPTNLPMSPDTVYRYVNSEADFIGGEARWIQPLGNHWQTRLSLSYVRAENTQFNEPAFGIPPFEAQAGLRYQSQGKRRWWIDLSASAAAKQDRVATSRLELATPGWAVLNIWSGVELSRQVELRAGVQNVGDRGYANHLNALNPFTGERIEEPGRNAYLMLRVDF